MNLHIKQKRYHHKGLKYYTFLEWMEHIKSIHYIKAETVWQANKN